MKTVRCLFCLFMIAALSLAALSAQPTEENTLARIFIVKVKTGMNAQFETAFKSHVQWRKEQGDPWQWDVYQIVNGELFGDYVLRSGDHSWADMDAYEEFLLKGAPQFYTAVGAYLESVDSYITRVDPSVTRWPEDAAGFRYLSIIDHWVKPGQTQAFVQAIKEIHEAIGTSGWPVHYAWEITLNGGRGNNLTLVLPHRNYQDMKAPEKPLPVMLTEVYGADKMQQLMKGITETIDYTESHLIRLRPDLSLRK